MTRGAAIKRIPRRVGIVVGFLALAAVPALGLSAFAAADTGTGTATGDATGRPGTPSAHPALTDAQKQCLADHGVTLPQRPDHGRDRSAPDTADGRAARRRARRPPRRAGCRLRRRDDRPGFGGPGFGCPGVRPRSRMRRSSVWPTRV